MKKERLKARGVRFADPDWTAVKAEAKHSRCRPSDVVRLAVRMLLRLK